MAGVWFSFWDLVQHALPYFFTLRPIATRKIALSTPGMRREEVHDIIVVERESCCAQFLRVRRQIEFPPRMPASSCVAR